MKKIVTILMLCCLTLSLCGCDFRTTQEYKELKKIYESYENGKEYTKETLFEQIGDPEYYQYKASYNSLFNEEKQKRKEELFDENTSEWYYDCYELPDPANPYSLVVTFDSDGTVTEMEFEAVIGG